LSEQEYYPEDSYLTPEERRRKRKQLQELPPSQIASAIDHDVTDAVAKEMRIRERLRFAKLAGMTEDVVERGQYMVAAGLAKVFGYEKFHRWSLYESKKGIFSRKERREEEEQRENVYMEGNE